MLLVIVVTKKRKYPTQSSYVSHDYIAGAVINPFNCHGEEAEEDEWGDLDDDIYYFSSNRKFIPILGPSKKISFKKGQVFRRSVPTKLNRKVFFKI